MESSEVLGRMRSNFQCGQWLSVTVTGDLFFSNWVLLESKRVLLSSEGSQEAAHGRPCWRILRPDSSKSSLGESRLCHNGPPKHPPRNFF